MIEQNLETEFDIFEDIEMSKKKKKGYTDLMEMYNTMPIIVAEPGSVINAVYEGISSDEYVFSCIGLKDDIRIEKRPSESQYIEALDNGESVDVLITDVNNSDFMIKGSIFYLYKTKAFNDLKKLDIVTIYVKSMNPAGYDVDVIQGKIELPGFMPNTLAGINKLHDPSCLIGETLDVMIESFSESEGTYIVSRKRYLQSLIKEEAGNLEKGVIYSGSVTGTTSFGVFVEFNSCLTGMIHKANLREDWQDRIDEIEPGFEVEFFIKDVLFEKGKKYPKIILTQILRESLWDTIEVGNVLEGTVREIKKFGALVNLDEETIGLIHVNILEKVNKKLEKGDKVKVKVISIDSANRKIFLDNA